ncbi:MAG: futalosine hydrolase [Bacteroidia bacterium]|nr:futalosine hydrolase [Bacteroidia bacterium]
MRILIVTATPAEVSSLPTTVQTLKKNVVFLETGVGMTAMAMELTRMLSLSTFDAALNVGVAGSFFSDIRVGDVVNVVKDNFSELGAEDGEQFLSLDEMGLGEAAVQPLQEFSNPVLDKLPRVTGITVNTVHGNELSIDKVFGRLHPFVESMEGAAFFKVCNAFRLPCAQVRAISNRVERRNRQAWKLDSAIDNLQKKVLEILTSAL